jgi:hypothetical protein
MYRNNAIQNYMIAVGKLNSYNVDMNIIICTYQSVQTKLHSHDEPNLNRSNIHYFLVEKRINCFTAPSVPVVA